MNKFILTFEDHSGDPVILCIEGDEFNDFLEIKRMLEELYESIDFKTISFSDHIVTNYYLQNHGYRFYHLNEWFNMNKMTVIG